MQYITLSRTNGTTKQGSPYAQLKLANEQETFTVAVWDCPNDGGPQIGQLVTFNNIQERDGKRSARFVDMYPAEMAGEQHPLYHLIPRPTALEDWQRCISNLLSYCTDEKLKAIIAKYAADFYSPYAKWPAATSMHHAFPGGLVVHTYQMLHMLEGLYPVLPYEIKVERCILAILFHDYGKLKEYNAEGETQKDMYLLGHIYMSAFTLQHVLDEAGIDREEKKYIIHCVLAHHGEKEYGSPVTPCLQEAVVVNLLDNLSAKTDCLERAGDMEYCPALETRAVKH